MSGNRNRSARAGAARVILSLCVFFLALLFLAWPGGQVRAAFDLCSYAPVEPETVAVCREEQPVLSARLDWLRERYFLPDLQTLPPFDLYTYSNERTGQQMIRFSNSVVNRGAGPLELRGDFIPKDTTIFVTQVLHSQDGLFEHGSRVGDLEFHPEHNHWHWIGFSIYEIWSLDAVGNLDEKLRTSGKVGYCMLDTSPADDELLRELALSQDDIPEHRQYWQCSWRLQGISTGWVDTYSANIPGQSMDVTGLPNGLYALRSTVDPDGLLIEADRRNNTAVTYFVLRNNRLSVVEADQINYLPPYLLESSDW